MTGTENMETEVQEVNETPEKQPQKHSVWFWINILYVVLGIFPGMLFIWCLATFGIFVKLFPVQVILCALLGVAYNSYKRDKKDKKRKRRLYILRFSALAVTAVIFLSPLALIKFNGNKAAYPLKKFAYTYGVGNTERCRQILPRSLPSECRDYKFITQSSIGGLQDYRPSAYLFFHTDSDTLRLYEERISSLSLAERYENVPKSFEEYGDDYDSLDDDIKRWINRPEKLPQHVYGRFCNDISDRLDNAVVYRIGLGGCMLNYESGLAVFWA